MTTSIIIFYLEIEDVLLDLSLVESAVYREIKLLFGEPVQLGEQDQLPLQVLHLGVEGLFGCETGVNLEGILLVVAGWQAVLLLEDLGLLDCFVKALDVALVAEFHEKLVIECDEARFGCFDDDAEDKGSFEQN